MTTHGNFMQSEQDRGLARRSAIDRKRPAASVDFSSGGAATSRANGSRCHRLNQPRHAWAQRNLRTSHRKHAAWQPPLNGVKPA